MTKPRKVRLESMNVVQGKRGHLFVKLPQWFKVDTPVGSYNPDWAFVTERDEKLYFARETKSTKDSEELRKKEN